MTKSCRWILILLLNAFTSDVSWALDNGLALTPPMGWMSWLRFLCSYRCDLDPENCISERLFIQIADRMAEDGYLDAGYNYLSIDDCWMEMSRDANNRLQADAKRFPSGMKALADYVHSKRLKLGLYLDIGVKTCAGYPGSHGFIDLDAQTMADWGVDMIKFDGCHANLTDYARDFPAMARALNKTGRPIVYSCQWPMYAKYFGGEVNYTAIAKTCNMFRALTDIYINYHSVESMILYWGSNPYNFSSVVGPGSWNDPDVLTIGNSGLSEKQEKVQMAMWAIMVSPMLMSNDLRNVKKSSRDILLNKNVIAINQDPLGIQGTRYLQSGSISVWQKPVLPRGSIAIAIMSTANNGNPILTEYSLSSLPTVRPDQIYEIFEVFEMKSLGLFMPYQIIKVYVEATGVVLLKAVPTNPQNTDL
ncbi:hypothetical protein HELRODRAFT_74316 [Helobdella robusta]|uniref:Alpha-galactosidase n=1 Tax=Helobdella robusta TaxID=6412 RepID=T1G1P7_HELRO|nr:hypothetical protein HELRODRAFT_74316 [Helobdella robusta]ESO09162.1 hypothetical protein HELRODRAFT_74316 [Helobdella robusta]